ncbi:MAG: carboxypeptidase-like regulatory domain-containing protein, partial [bacterium]
PPVVPPTEPPVVPPTEPPVVPPVVPPTEPPVVPSTEPPVVPPIISSVVSIGSSIGNAIGGGAQAILENVGNALVAPADVVTGVIKNINESQIVKEITGINKAVRDVIKADNLIVQTVNQGAAPAVAAAVSLATVAAVTAISWWNFIAYLQFLFTEPLFWLFGRKKKDWGVVYHSVTKQPVDLAIVRLYNKADNRLIRSKVTDKQGRYAFFTDTGNYYLTVTKPNFVFPSVILNNSVEDKKYADLYYGNELIIPEGKEGMISANIPLDPGEVVLSDKQILREYDLKSWGRKMALLGPVFALVSFAVSPNKLTFVLILVHFAMYGFFRRLAQKTKTKGWGVIYDKSSKGKLEKAVVRIFSPEYGKMLDYQVTDKAGRYGFITDENAATSFYVTSNKDGYQNYKSENVSLADEKAMEKINRDIELAKQSEAVVVAEVPNSPVIDSATVKLESELENKSEIKSEDEPPKV